MPGTQKGETEQKANDILSFHDSSSGQKYPILRRREHRILKTETLKSNCSHYKRIFHFSTGPIYTAKSHVLWKIQANAHMYYYAKISSPYLKKMCNFRIIDY